MGKTQRVAVFTIGIIVTVALLLFGYNHYKTAAPNINSSAATTTSSSAPSATASATATGIRTCAPTELPEQARTVVKQIRSGGPFKHPNDDGKRFGNYEKILPQKPKDFYREYTVDTPGLKHRGTRRIITGGNKATEPDVWYYTKDHYESFCEITNAKDLK